MRIIRDICRDALIKTRAYSSRLILGYLRASGVVGGECLSRLVSTGWISEDKGSVLLGKVREMEETEECQRRQEEAESVKRY